MLRDPRESQEATRRPILGYVRATFGYFGLFWLCSWLSGSWLPWVPLREYRDIRKAIFKDFYVIFQFFFVFLQFSVVFPLFSYPIGFIGILASLGAL